MVLAMVRVNVSCSLNVKCDTHHCSETGWYGGSTVHECRQKAKAAGWMLGRITDRCPACIKVFRPSRHLNLK